MKEKAREPAIRFSEFAGAWEQRVLGDFLEVSMETNSSAKFDKNDVLSISGDYGVVNQIAFQGRSFASNSVVKYGVLHNEDIVYTKSPLKANPYGIIKTNKGKAGIVSPLYAIYHPKNNLVPSFVQSYFEQNERLNNYLRPLVNKGAKNNMLISNEKAISGKVIFPSRKEQEKISALLERVDSLLTLHQRKYEQFLILKESMIQKLFPKDGEHAPEIRFSGCAGDWEQRLLGDIYLERNERGSKSLDILSVSIHSGISEKNLDAGALGKIVRRSEDKSLYKHVFPGDLVFNMMRAWQGALGVVKKEGMVSPAYISAIPNAEVYPGFMNYCLRRKNVINQINNLSYGVTDFRKRLYWDSFVKIKISLPSISEQKKITEFLTRLDAAINLHKRRLGMLKNVKQAFLEKMFI